MIALLALLIHMPVSADLTPVLGGRPLNGAQLVFVSDNADWVFSFNQRPLFHRYDIDSGTSAYEGEKITVGTVAGPNLRILTVNQGHAKEAPSQVMPGHSATVQPLAAVARDSLLVVAGSGGVAPEDEVSKLARRTFALCLVRPDASANSVYPLPADEYGWYFGVDAHRDEKTLTIDVLMAHVLGKTAATRLESFRIAEGKLQKAPRAGRYAQLDGKRIRVWKSVQAARGAWDDGPKIAVDGSGGVAFVTKDFVTVNDIKNSLPNVSWVRFIRGRLFAGTRRNPDMKTLAETFEWDEANDRFALLGGFEVAGASPNGKYWVVHFPHNGRFRIAPVR